MCKVARFIMGPSYAGDGFFVKSKIPYGPGLALNFQFTEVYRVIVTYTLRGPTVTWAHNLRGRKMVSKAHFPFSKNED